MAAIKHTFDAGMDKAARSYIKSLAADSAGTDREDVWYCIAKSVAFAACNQGQYVADVYLKAIQAKPDDVEFMRHVLRRIKESIIKTGIIYGIPRVINAFRALIKVIPSDSANETSSIRTHIAEPATTDERGIAYMRNIFQADLDPFLNVMDTYWPDLRTLVVTTIYGYYQSDVSVVDGLTTSMLNIAALVPMDVTAEVAWHMRGTVRNGGTRGDIDFAYGVAMGAVRICDVKLKNTMPRPEEVVDEERLF